VILLDTTILAYAVGSDHPLREPCRRLLQSGREGRIQLATSVEVIQEFVHVHSRRRPRETTTALARAYLSALDVLTTSPDDLTLGLALFIQHPELGALDAVLAGLALNRKVQALVSADGAFGQVRDLRWIDPATSALDALLGS
jgi:predicted nucleic acid-binding protein